MITNQLHFEPSPHTTALLLHVLHDRPSELRGKSHLESDREEGLQPGRSSNQDT